MRAMQATTFVGYTGLGAVDVAPPEGHAGSVLIRVTAAGVTPLDHTILHGKHPRAIAPLILGGEAVGIVEDSGGTDFKVGSRVIVSGSYGMQLPGTWQELMLVSPDDLVVAPQNLTDVQAAAMPVAYLTGYLALMQAGFRAGMSVLTPAIGGSVGNATYQLARALGAGKVISTSGSLDKSKQATAHGYSDVIDLSSEGLIDGVQRITEGAGVDIVVDGVGGPLFGEALTTLARGGSAVTLGYSGGREFKMDVTTLIWKIARVSGFSLFSQSKPGKAKAWESILPLVGAGQIRPLIARSYPLEEAADALRDLIVGRPFGRVMLTMT